MRLQEIGGRGRFVVELGDVAITLGVVVVGVDHDLVGERLDRHRPIVFQRNRHYDDVSGLRCIESGGRSRFRSELGDECR